MCYCINWSAIEANAVVLTTIITGIIAFVANKQLKDLNKTSQENSSVSKADFIDRFNVHFFTDEVCELFTLFEYNMIKFETTKLNNKPFYYFKVDENTLAHFDFLKKPKKLIYTSNEIDFMFLGNFENLGIFDKSGLLNKTQVYDEFAYYIEKMSKNKEILTYIQIIRKESADFYCEWEALYKKHTGKVFDFSVL